MSITDTVKDTAARVGLPARTLRYYDRIGLVRAPRNASGYRVYGPEEEGRLRFVCRAKTLGLSLEEIRELLGLAKRSRSSDVAAEVKRLLGAKIAAIDAQVAALAALRERLVAFREGGQGLPSGHDSFWSGLNEGPPPGATPQTQLPPQPTSETVLRGELERFKVELRAGGLRASTVHHYLVGSSLFVRWLAGEYVPGPGRADRPRANSDGV